MSAGCGATVHGIGALDRLSRGTSPIHTLDPRAKLAVTLAFAIAVASVPKYALDTLLPFAVFPLFMLIQSEIPASFVLRRLAVLAPFAVVAGAFNPLLDTHTVLRIGGVGISGGWLSFVSILVRFVLTIGALIVLAASTGVPALGHAAKKLGAPRALVTQILGLYRYLFLTLEELQRTLLAWRLRNPRGRASLLAGLRADPRATALAFGGARGAGARCDAVPWLRRRGAHADAAQRAPPRLGVHARLDRRVCGPSLRLSG